MKTIKGYKFIQEDMTSREGSIKWEIGKWKKHDGNLKICEKGFHACRTAIQSLEYIYGEKWFIVEARGGFKEIKEDKFVCSEMRLIREIPINKVVQLFAIRCAKNCLKNYEKVHPDDKRVYWAIEGAELYLAKKINIKEMKKRIVAVEDAALSAAEYAALSVAEYGAATKSVAEYMAKSVAEYAALSAKSAAKSVAEYAALSAKSAAKSAALYAAFSSWHSIIFPFDYSEMSAAFRAAKAWQEKELEKIIKDVLK